MRRWWPVLPLGVAVAVGAVLITHHSGADGDSAPPSRTVAPTTSARSSTPNLPPSRSITTPPSTTSTPASSTPASSTPASSTRATTGKRTIPPTTSSPITVTQVGHPILGITEDWDLYASSSEGRLVRVELATGRVTITEPPGLPVGITSVGTGDRSLRAVAGTAFVEMLTDGAIRRFLVPDGRPADVAPGLLQTAAQVWPGPEPGQWWVTGIPEAGSAAVDARAARLIDSGGRELGPRLEAPAATPDGSAWLGDGAGGLVFQAAGGVYRIDTGGVQRLSDGGLIALSDGRLLTVECDVSFHCRAGLTEAATGRRQELTNFPAERLGWDNYLSPDGKMLATRVYGMSSTSLELIDLDTGRTHSIEPAPSSTGNLEFSPDHRFLFYLDQRDRIGAIETATGRQLSTDIDVGDLQNLSIVGRESGE